MLKECHWAFAPACAIAALLIHASAAQADPTLSDEVLVLGHLSVQSPEAAREQLTKIPGGVSLVTAEDFENRYAVGFQDMLANVPGVFAHLRYGEEVRLSIRGSGLSRSFHLRGIRLLLDGVPLTAADGGGDFQEIDPLIVRHIEVYKGGNGLRYGAASLGGAVNVVSPTARTVDYRGLLQAEGGSFSTARLHGAYAWAGETADAYIAATGVTSDGYRAQSKQDKVRMSGNVGLKIGDGGETRFYLWANEINQEVPGALSLTNALQNSKAVQPINEINDYARDIRSLRIANRTILPAAEGLLEFGVYGTLKSLYHPIFQVIDQDSKEAGAYIRWSGDVGPVEWTLGANLGWGIVDAKQFINVGGHRGALTADSDQKSLNVEGYGEARFQVDDAWTLIAGAQVLRARRIYDNHRSPAANDRETFSSFSPKVGVLWEPVKETQVFANLSRSVEPPTFSELVQFPVVGFVPLDAQRAWTAEVGSRGESGRFTWDITGYWSWLKGEMLQFITNPTIPAATFNTDKTTHRGIEAGAGVTVTDELALRLVYAFNDFRFRNDAQYGDNKIAGLPRHMARIEASYSHDCGLTLTPSVEWAMSRAYVDFANTMTTPRYAVINLAASWRHEDGWRLYLDARNLANKHYVSDIGTVVNATTAPNLNVFYPGDGRSVYAGVVREF